MSRGSLVIVSTISKSSSCLGAVEESNSSVTRELNSCAKRRIELQKLQRASWEAEVAQISGCSEKK